MHYNNKKDIDLNPKYKIFLRENSSYYKDFNRNNNYFNLFKKIMKDKYKLNTVDKIDNIIDSIDIISKIFNATK